MMARGYTLIELLLALVAGSVVLAAVYASYAVVARQQQGISAASQVQEMGVPTIRFLEQHLRNAGYVTLDADLDPLYGGITLPVDMVDSGNACCDQLRILYDVDTPTSRQQVIFYVLPRANPVRNALYMDINTWDGAAWTNTTNAALVADYVEDFQVQPVTLSGFLPELVDVNLTLRSRHVLPDTRNYAKPAYDIGNHAYNFTDNYFRESFSTTIHLKNVVE